MNFTNIQVDKYGGSSLKDASSVEKTIQNALKVHSENKRLLEVVSAPGKMKGTTLKMTDRVKQGALHSIQNKSAFPEDCARYVKDHFSAIYVELGLSDQEIQQSLHEHFFSRIQKHIPHGSDRSMLNIQNQECYASLISAPESVNAALRVALYKKRNIPAFLLDPQENIIVKGELLNAHYDEIASIPLIQKSFSSGHGIAVRPGFQGITKEGRFAVFPRGGSDITGAIDAEALNASLYRNCTDVHGVKEVDPRLFEGNPSKVENIKTIPHLTYEEIEELAITGASVIHPLAIAPLRRASTTMKICHSFDLNGPSTTVSMQSQETPSIKGLAFIKGMGYVVLHSPNMIGEPGYLEKFSEAFKKYNVDIEMVYTSPTVIAANTKDIDKLLLIKQSLSEHGNVYCGFNTGMVSIVGDGYQGNPKIAMRFLAALTELGKDIPIHRQTQALHSSYWISVDDTYVVPLAQKVYELFFGDRKNLPLQVWC